MRYVATLPLRHTFLAGDVIPDGIVDDDLIVIGAVREDDDAADDDAETATADQLAELAATLNARSRDLDAKATQLADRSTELGGLASALDARQAAIDAAEADLAKRLAALPVADAAADSPPSADAPPAVLDDAQSPAVAAEPKPRRAKPATKG